MPLRCWYLHSQQIDAFPRPSRTAVRLIAAVVPGKSFLNLVHPNQISIVHNYTFPNDFALNEIPFGVYIYIQLNLYIAVNSRTECEITSLQYKC